MLGEIGSRKLKDIEFVFLDTETTGLSYDSYIVEIGLIKFHGYRMVDTFNYLIKPPVLIPRNVIRVHGIDDSMVKNAPTFGELANLILDFLGDSILVIHNASFDVNVLAYNLAREGLGIPANYVIDTIEMVRAFFPKLGSYSLESLAKIWDSPYRTFHRALVDAKNTAFIFFSVLKKCGYTMEETFEELVEAIGNIKTFPDYCYKLKLELMGETDVWQVGNGKSSNTRESFADTDLRGGK